MGMEKTKKRKEYIKQTRTREKLCKNITNWYWIVLFGKISEKKINDEKIILLKPMTYMNLSGNSVQSILGLCDIGDPVSYVNKKFKKLALGNIPLGRAASESDIATTVCFLASSASSMITGTSIIIDGGWTAQ